MANLCNDPTLLAAGYKCSACNCGGSLKEKWLKGDLKINIFVRAKTFTIYKGNVLKAQGSVAELQAKLAAMS